MYRRLAIAQPNTRNLSKSADKTLSLTLVAQSRGWQSGNKKNKNSRERRIDSIRHDAKREGS